MLPSATCLPAPRPTLSPVSKPRKEGGKLPTGKGRPPRRPRSSNTTRALLETRKANRQRKRSRGNLEGRKGERERVKSSKPNPLRPQVDHRSDYHCSWAAKEGLLQFTPHPPTHPPTTRIWRGFPQPSEDLFLRPNLGVSPPRPRFLAGAIHTTFPQHSGSELSFPYIPTVDICQGDHTQSLALFTQ